MTDNDALIRAFRTATFKLARVGFAHPPVEAAGKPPAAAQRRIRRPSLESTAKQLWKAARAAGVEITMTVEGGAVTVTPAPVRAPAASSESNEETLFRIRPKKKVVL